MNWTSSTTPDDIAQQGDSLVASILRTQPASPAPAVPQWMRWHLDQIALRQRLRMNLR